MFRSLGLVFCVVVMAAFASGCGGGGGAAQMPDATEPDPPVVAPVPPADQTEAAQITEARQGIASILSNARTRAQAASSVSGSIRTNADATAAQITNATNNNTAARAALALIENANSAAIAATTPAAAQTALTNARAAQSTLNTAALAITSIQSALQTVANARRQRETDERAQTGGSSLIKHLSDNKKLSDAVLGDLAPASLVVGSTADNNTGSAVYPYHKGADPTDYPRPKNTDRGVLGVTVSVSTTDVSSNSQTGKISGSGRLSKGFDLKDGAGRFATVYTDITVAKRVRIKDDSTEDGLSVNLPSTEGIDERYQYVDDTDYLLAGIWLDDTTDGAPVLRAFAFGSQPLIQTSTFCTAADVTNTSTIRACGNATGKPFNTIAGFVDENESEDATYRGGVNGAYFAGGKASHFKANVSLTAKFVRGVGVDVAGSKISGEITNISAGGNSITGSIDLKEQSLATLTNLSSRFDAGEAAGVIAGHAYTGAWKGQFFGMRARKLTPVTTGTVAEGNRTTTTTYTPDMPGSVAGSFYVDRETVGEGDAAFIGAFGANR